MGIVYGKLKSGRFIKPVQAKELSSFHEKPSWGVVKKSRFVTVWLTSLYDMAEKGSGSVQVAIGSMDGK
jgi:hypothetical protein